MTVVSTVRRRTVYVMWVTVASDVSGEWCEEGSRLVSAVVFISGVLMVMVSVCGIRELLPFSVKFTESSGPQTIRCSTLINL